MEAEFWHERWESGRIRFNQAEANRLLVEHWANLACPPGGEVFVPLCGKSIDMAWLSSQGHGVVGNELSERAVSDFFVEQGLESESRAEGELMVHTAPGYKLWSGDFFEMSADALEGVAAVYDRASLVALPVDLRRRYAGHLTNVVPSGAPIFLVAFEYDEAEMDGPPFSVTFDEIVSLYGDAFELEQVVSQDTLAGNDDLQQRGLSRLQETLTILRR